MLNKSKFKLINLKTYNPDIEKDRVAIVERNHDFRVKFINYTKQPIPNPRVQKSFGEISFILENGSQIERNHAYCSPTCCQFYKGDVNCDSTLKEDVWYGEKRNKKTV